jgi:hypothetical protein
VNRLLGGRLDRHSPAAGAGEQEVPLEPALAQLSVQVLQVGARDGLHVGVNNGCAGALVLAVLAAEAVRERDRNLRALARQSFAHRQLVGGVGVTVQEAHGDRLNTLRSDTSRHFQCALLVEGGQNVALEVHPFLDLEGELARHQRVGLAIFEVVHRVARGTAQLVHVAKAACGHNSYPGSASRQERVNGQRSAVYEKVNLAQVSPGFLEPLQHPNGGVGRRGLHFVEPQAARLLVENDDVCEGPSDVH